MGRVLAGKVENVVCGFEEFQMVRPFNDEKLVKNDQLRLDKSQLSISM